MRSPLTPRELLISRRARLRYGLPDTLFATDGTAVLVDFRAVREAVSAINRVRRAGGRSESFLKASELHAAGLLHEIMHALVGVYRRTVNENIFGRALAELEVDLGVEDVEEVLEAFVEAFPPQVVKSGEMLSPAYLEGRTGDVANREVVLEELLLLWLANANPALEDLRDLFDDNDLRRQTTYLALVDRLQVFFRGQPGIVPGGLTLIEMLRAPVVAAPHSLQGQLDHIRLQWGPWLAGLVLRLLGGLDFLAEENKPFFPPGPGPAEAPMYPASADEEAAEAFSPDRDWMPRVVLLAKNSHVWLAQLSEQYGRPISTLDEVPDAELDRLAGWGITGLWLIGIWERSRASAKIKQWMGDSEAVASAYSLYDYVVASDLGGEEAFEKLKVRAWQRGIRMTTDMVPNHVGIDGRWVVEHPDWFVGSETCPFPQYSFGGADLSDDDRVGVHIEDGYWDKTDAAVVFKRVDGWTGNTRYIYHGNDGTSMPWNDTAQLDYRNPEVREAVIRTILHVARLSPIIRFDAAMTLTRKNFQRLWFPEPGSGGDIPSRAEHGMTGADFDQVMPEEFWREVVDRVAAEAPDTLLLAEAFWMLEGYFVRTLGMHRVYNSAFMNMLHEEKNDEYRKLIRNTLEYDPRILNRYVNFMSNPDERTAIDQFGRDDKYFGVCTLMATMPGLPMLGHGQVEGFAEKYGMEFRRPRWNEEIDQGIVARHEHQIFPLLRRRHLFSGVDRFRLYDLIDGHGDVDENVFAYSNEAEGERSLVVFHNCFKETAGWIHRAVPIRVGGELLYPNLADGLDLKDGDGSLVSFRDAISGLEYLRFAQELRDRGLFVDLKAYELHVFLDFLRVEDDDEKTWSSLASHLDGNGVVSLEKARRELAAAPVLEPWRRLMTSDALKSLLFHDSELRPKPSSGPEEELLDLFVAARKFIDAPGSAADDVDRVLDLLRDTMGSLRAAGGGVLAEKVNTFTAGLPWRFLVVAAWAIARRLNDLGTVVESGRPAPKAADRFEDWYFGDVLAKQAAVLGAKEKEAARCGDVVSLLLETQGWVADLVEHGSPQRTIEELLRHRVVSSLLGVNLYDDTVWFTMEGLETMVDWLTVGAYLENTGDMDGAKVALDFVDRLRKSAAASGFKIDKLIKAM